MPIYYDYHGDSRSSSISSWDQIQISLKSLLPNYEPILCDSAIVGYFLSDQPQKHFSADFEQNLVSENADQEIDNTDQELTIDPTQFHQIQEITDLDFQFQSQFQSELATTRSSKFKFNQNSISVSVSTTVTPTEASDCGGFPKITKQIDAEVTIVPYGGGNGWIERDRQSESVMKPRSCLRSACNEGKREELWVPPLKSAEEAEAIHPPPAPPDLYSLEVVDGDPPDLKSIAVGDDESASAKATEIHSGAEVNAIAMGNMVHKPPPNL
ncbi:hypothetical protein PIB30_043313 [Stylosanthes scabra]|uniref:Uncharacterized protein n=1 Tax=Stylosanthes scabra TaxID=79078 RepID=A0ABU6QG89_9FABA|nr:hypothetical protein [Stylosanthes scabra]